MLKSPCHCFCETPSTFFCTNDKLDLSTSIRAGKDSTNENTSAVEIKTSGNGQLFERVLSILEQARKNVVKAVNSNMIIAYWLIGKEIVEEVQKGENRAEYGNNVVKNLSKALIEKYNKGFSTTNLWYFRQFYSLYSNRKPVILHTVCGELLSEGENKISHTACGVLDDLNLSVTKCNIPSGFSSELSWSHYRALTRVEHENERLFYEIEAEKQNWSVRHLERQINSFLFARLLKSRDKEGVMQLSRNGQIIEKPSDIIKNPYILDFLGLPESERLYETKLEQSIISNIQSFLLELGKGFAFVARQKRISTENSYFYVDLVFYNYFLKCFVLIDLKVGELTHQDVGQMDMYVRMFDDLQKGKDDNPTVGIILCSEKDKAVVKYSVLNENKQLFASKYMLYLPTEIELKRELKKDREAIENIIREELSKYE